MAAPTTYFVDPSINADSGAGTVGDPYGDTKYAVDQNTFDTTNGNKLAIKSGTDEVLTESLNTTFTTNSWSPTANAPIIIEGYSTAEGDGGIGGISGNGSIAIINSTALDFIFLKDLHMHNTGSANVCTIGENCVVDNVEFDNSTGDGLTIDRFCNVIQCFFHDLAGDGIAHVDHGTTVLFCHFVNDGTSDMDNCVVINNGGNAVGFCLFDIDGSTDGIFSNHNTPYILIIPFTRMAEQGQASICQPIEMAAY